MMVELLMVNPARMALMLVCLIFAGLAEGFGFMTLLPVLELATNQNLNPDNAISQFVVSVHDALGLTPNLGVLLVIVVLSIVLKSMLTLVAVRNIGYAAADFTAEARLALIRNLMSARWSYFVGQRAGRLSNAIGTEAGQAAAVYNAMANLLSTGIQALIFSLLAFVSSWQVTVLGLLAGGVIIVLLRKFVSIAREAGQSQVSLMNALLARFADGIQLMKPLKAMGLEDQLGPILEHETKGIKSAQRQMMFSSAALHSFQEPLLTLFLAIGVYSAIQYESFLFANLVFMAVLFQRIVSRTGGLQVQYQKMAGYESAYWSIRGAIKEASLQCETHTNEGVSPKLEKGIRLENVRFAYDEAHVLKGVTINVPANAFTTIVGTSGAGKTTLVDLVIGLIEPTEGCVSIDGIDQSDVDMKEWRHSIGYVPQEQVLLHDTIAGNISLDDSTITRQDIEDALQMAGAWEFVQAMPDGLETIVGERGVRFSGGQRQRIAIARALVRKPKLLILDEPTTALDSITEQEICKTLATLSVNTTILAISHQQALVEVADFVYKLKQGQLVDSQKTQKEK